jgi:hypothetical protein
MGLFIAIITDYVQWKPLIVITSGHSVMIIITDDTKIKIFVFFIDAERKCVSG